ncbi:MAG: LytR C-terminal domain-containing protein [Gemmatimonadota bacterium]
MRSRIARIGLIAAGALLLVTGVVLAARLKRDQVPGHAYAVPSADNRIIIEVMNGTGRQGLGRTVTRILRQQGLDVVLFGNADSTDSTRIVVRRGDRKAAETVARALGTGQVIEQIDTLRRVDVSVILGYDYKPAGEIHP